MSFKDIAQIAGSAMAAQTVRLNTIASNLANADAASSTEASTYRARKPVFASIFKVGADGEVNGAAVQVLDVVQSTEPLRKVHQPGNPLADADGNVLYPNVDPVEEMTDMLSSTRAYSTNVEVLGRVNGMQMELLKLGQ
ncbi:MULTISPECIES: flagellar basal body rod protein FlgC [pseudomallei group]|uniref:Flagellar basal-body rod protein FlgC n=2 Tax=pseudomallei group TaxID=111527 RepID=A0A1B4FQQ4_9BURK|nr:MULTISPECIES: flagellar basal body rod protein FlgC [pseudomallei group]AIO70682.1 flagellar basal-body rod protein FlgC [Burkholderia oklahomensis]AJX36078.1 flagellar basal-body rod protein FlgC [Burkholderia oklahomensis C6786]AOI38249.1 flagellar basal-body rod protein FlgC [Burkholderia oklahomensis EO147]AOI47972.1 flagellar basal-body rod protein FlgC [Burkholderia oklahomensis C6786]AOJ06002.1 flagellar basal-body rod protein FlgC [Burkholderia mayonis]